MMFRRLTRFDDGTHIHINLAQVSAIKRDGNRTTVHTMAGTFYVKEVPDEILAPVGNRS